MEITHKSRAKYGNKVCDNLPNATQLQSLRWYKSLTEQDLGLMEDKMLHFSEWGISAVFQKPMILMLYVDVLDKYKRKFFLLNIVLMDLSEVMNGLCVLLQKEDHQNKDIFSESSLNSTELPVELADVLSIHCSLGYNIWEMRNREIPGKYWLLYWTIIGLQ